MFNLNSAWDVAHDLFFLKSFLYDLSTPACCVIDMINFVIQTWVQLPAIAFC